MLGLPMTALSPPGPGAGPAAPSPAAAPQPAAPQIAPEAQAAAQAPPTGKPPVASNRTMLGMAMPMAGQAGAAPQPAGAAPQPAPAQAAPAKAAPGPTTNRTMLGVAVQPGAGGAPAAPAPAAAMPGYAGQAAQPAPYGAPAAEDPYYPEPPRKKSRVGLFVGLLFLLLAAAGAAAAAYFFFASGTANVRATIVSTETGESLQVDVPEAEPGTKLRFNGVESELEAGRAAFPLAEDRLQLGDNNFVVDVIGPGGSVEQAQIVVSVPYRVRADLSALEDEPPTLRMVVDALPGSTVSLDEESVTLDANGHGSREYPLDSGDDSPHLERVVRYRVVVPEGQPADGQVTTRIPFATLQLDRPGASSLTDKERLEVVGAAHPEARVTLDGEAVELNGEGRFRTYLEIGEVGSSEHVVVAHQAGRAPRRRTLQVRRVADLRQEAASYPVDADITYAHLTQNPDAYRGHKAAFVGRVYNVDVGDGKSVLQMIVRDCPTGQRCPIWVNYDGATDAEINSWVRAVGELAGEQQFRSPSGQVISVPRIDAVFVLSEPAESPSRGTRRRRRRR